MQSLRYYLDILQYYLDKVEQHLPIKPSKWDRKYKIAVLCLGIVFFIMAIVAFALHDKVIPGKYSIKANIQKIVNYLAPYAQLVAEYPGSWLVPIICLVIISFPPLFGHELIAMYLFSQKVANVV
jgi:hypothetical protein